MVSRAEPLSSTWLLSDIGQKKEGWGCWLGRKIGGVCSLAGAAAAIALKVVNYCRWGSQPQASTLLSLAAGASLQSASIALLPLGLVGTLLQVEERNAMLIFFTATQFFDNVGASGREGIGSFLTALGGAWCVIKIIRVVSQKLSDLPFGQEPLSEKKFDLYLPQNKWAVVSGQVVKALLGGAMIGLEIGFPQIAPHGKNIGAFLISHAAGNAIQNAWHAADGKESVQKDVEWPEEIPFSVRCKQIISGFCFAAGSGSLGIIFYFNTPVSYATAGAVLGMVQSTTQTAFQNSAIEDLKYVSPTVSKVQQAVNRIVPVLITAWYTTGMALSDLSGRVALTVFFVSGTISAATTAFINLRWQRDPASAGQNTLRYYTREGSFVLALPAMYLMNQMRIDDVALNRYGTAAQLAAAGAWASFGAAIGNGLFNPVSFDISPPAQMLLARFIAEEMGAKG